MPLRSYTSHRNTVALVYHAALYPNCVVQRIASAELSTTVPSRRRALPSHAFTKHSLAAAWRLAAEPRFATAERHIAMP